MPPMASTAWSAPRRCQLVRNGQDSEISRHPLPLKESQALHVADRDRLRIQLGLAGLMHQDRRSRSDAQPRIECQLGHTQKTSRHRRRIMATLAESIAALRAPSLGGTGWR